MVVLGRHIAIIAVGLAMAAGSGPARADSGPVFVVPSTPGVPIAINGRDASWSVVEGDIGLARPGHLSPVIIGGGRPLPPRRSYDRVHYFPRYGTVPERGRREIEPSPDRPLPEPAESYHRSWSTSSDPGYSVQRYVEPPRQGEQGYRSESDMLPPTIEDPQQQQFMPPIVVVPRGGRR